ncbi:hypothetical protein [Streptococcus mitis]|uniref:hypothetical protein n=1 Tax=Streptococcus mitis TaxID=28037 RepID=UPI001CEC53D3
MKIKEQTKKLTAGCSKHCFEVVDKTDEVSSKHGFEVVNETDEVSNHTYGKATLTRFEEIFIEYEFNGCQSSLGRGRVGRGVVLPSLHT